MAITDILTLKPEFNLEESIEFKTIVDEAEDGSEVRDSLIDSGLREYKLRTQYISDDEMEVIWQFYLARKGSEDDFLIKILTEFLVVDEPIATGDGSTIQFVLQKFPVDTADNHSAVLDGIANVNYVLSNDTVNEISYITFNTAPALGVDITLSYEYYFRMRFLKDELTRELLNYKLTGAGIELREVRWNTYFPIGGLSSSSSSSSAASLVSMWYPVQGAIISGNSGSGFTQDANIRKWNGSDFLYQSSLIKSYNQSIAQVTTSMIFTRMIIELTKAPGIGKKRVFTLYVNDLPTNITCTIADLEIIGDINGFVSCSNGDYVYMREDKYGDPTKSHVMIGFAVSTGNPRRQPLLGPAFWMAWAPILNNSNNGAAGVFSSYGGDTLRWHSLITTPGVLRNMQCRNYRAAGHRADNGDINELNSRIIKKVGSDKFYQTGIEAVISDLEVRGQDLENSDHVVNGDFIAWEGSAFNPGVPTMNSIDFEPDNPKHSNNCLTSGQGGPFDTTSPKYCFIHAYDDFTLVSPFAELFGCWTEEASTLFAIPGIIKNITIWWGNISIDASYPATFIVRKNGVDTALTATLTNIVQKVVIPGQLTVDVRDKISIRTVPIAVLPSNQGSSETWLQIAWTFVSSNGGEWPIFLTRTTI